MSIKSPSSVTVDSENTLYHLQATLSSDASDMSDMKAPIRKKVRQHVNPLASRYLVPITMEPDWIQNAFNLTKPTHTQQIIIDVGCSRGSWALNSAKLHPDILFLGLEIRRPVVELALERKSFNKQNNVHYIACNANIDLMPILRSLASCSLSIDCICIQFPDPHFKARHKKRRVVNEELVAALASGLCNGVKLFVQSDVEEVAYDMVDSITTFSDSFAPMPGYNAEALQNNPSPMDVQTEREIATIKKGLPVYRMLFVKKSPL